MLMSMNKKTFFSWLASTTNLKDVSTFYFIFGLFSGFVGSIFSLLIRTELRMPGPTFLSESAYNVIITAHGLIMIFFFVMPVLMGGFGNWLLPLLLGCGDMAFPRLNNLSFWLLPLSLSLLIISSLVVNSGVGSDWTLFYFTFSSLVGHQGGLGVDLGILSIIIAGASSIGGSINFLCTIILNINLNNFNVMNIFHNFNILMIFSLLVFISTVGWIYILDLYLLMMDSGFSGGPSGSGSGSQYNFNNPNQPPKGDPSGAKGLLKDEKMKEKLSELKENLDKENKGSENKENINSDSKVLSSESKEDTISSSSSSDRSSKHGSQERLLKDKTNKKKWKCNIA